MDDRVSVLPLDREGIAWAQGIVTARHYLRRPVDSRCSVEGYSVHIAGRTNPVGLFLVGRPEATRCGNWYGDVADVQMGRCEVTRWQVLNLARVWFDSDVQRDGHYYQPKYLPGFFDRKGSFRSTLVSTAVQAMMARVGADYLVRRPPCFLDEPYQIQWLLSYCNTSLHKGTIYQAAGFTLFRTNDDGIQTWRIPLPPLTEEQDVKIRHASKISPRANRYRAERAQLSFGF